MSDTILNAVDAINLHWMSANCSDTCSYDFSVLHWSKYCNMSEILRNDIVGRLAIVLQAFTSEWLIRSERLKTQHIYESLLMVIDSSTSNSHQGTSIHPLPCDRCSDAHFYFIYIFEWWQEMTVQWHICQARLIYWPTDRRRGGAIARRKRNSLANGKIFAVIYKIICCIPH